MVSREYYARERELFPTEFATKLTDTEAEYVFRRLKAHYHFTQEIRLRGHRGGGNCNPWRIRLSHEPFVGVLAHEVAHAIRKRKPGQKLHTKRHTAIMRSVCYYAMSHLSQWREFLKRKDAEDVAF